MKDFEEYKQAVIAELMFCGMDEDDEEKEECMSYDAATQLVDDHILIVDGCYGRDDDIDICADMLYDEYEDDE